MSSVPASWLSTFDPTPPHPCERLARLEGQSNFLSLLSGVEAGPDTTLDAGALGMVRSRCIPEILEAYWGSSNLYRYVLGQVVFNAIEQQGAIKERDRVWTKGAILDAFDRVRAGSCAAPSRQRSRQFGVSQDHYLAARKLAEGMFTALEGDARPMWMRARLRG